MRDPVEHLISNYFYKRTVILQHRYGIDIFYYFYTQENSYSTAQVDICFYSTYLYKRTVIIWYRKIYSSIPHTYFNKRTVII